MLVEFTGNDGPARLASATTMQQADISYGAQELVQLVQACEPGAFGDQEQVAVVANHVVAA
jgi:hypothetical protein